MTILDYLLIDNIARRNDPINRREEYRQAQRNAAAVLRHPFLFCLFIGFLIASFKTNKYSVLFTYFFIICSVWCVAAMALIDNGIKRRIYYLVMPLGFICLLASVLLFLNNHRLPSLPLFIAGLVFCFVLPFKIEAYAKKVYSQKDSDQPTVSAPSPDSASESSQV